MLSHVDAFQRRHRVAGFPLAVLYKFVDDQGSYLAALLTYYAFVSLFPLLLLLSTVLGLVLAGNPSAQSAVLHSALSQFPVIGRQLSAPKQLSGGAGGLVVGVLGALYGGVGVAQALQNALNTAWRIPRNSRPNPVKARARSLLLLLTFGCAVAATSVLSAFGNGAAGVGGWARVLSLGGSFALAMLVFVVVFRLGVARPLTVREVFPGAAGAATVWQLMQTFGAAYVAHVIGHTSESNGVFAVVLGLLAFLYVTFTAIVICAEVNVVLVEQLHPRALLTPFTDAVQLTAADERAYSSQATAQRSKGFEHVEVTFDPPGQA